MTILERKNLKKDSSGKDKFEKGYFGKGNLKKDSSGTEAYEK